MSRPARTVAQAPGRRVLLGVTGGIAAYKSAELLRLLTKGGFSVQVAMTSAAEQFVTPLTFQALSGQPVWTDLWDTRAVPGAAPNAMAHIELSRHTDLIVIAPASADFIAKLAQGRADDLLSTVCLARDRARCQLAIAPAMNREMWENPATQRNVDQLRADGIVILGPEGGDQACGEIGLGRMREPEALRADVEALLSGTQEMQGLHVMVTAGPTFEAIDPVRGITNSSSGKMGYAIAEAAKRAGARVTLISGPTALSRPGVDKVIEITSANQLFDAVTSNISDVDVFFAVAAVADYTPKVQATQKLKKNDRELTLELIPTQDVLGHVAGLKHPPFCVGFAAESENVVEYASKKRQKKNIPLIIANHANSAIGANDNEVTLISAHQQVPLPKASKPEVARQIVNYVADMLSQSQQLKLVRPQTGRP